MTTQLEPWSDLTDKVVMVTGASSGIGKELCLDLAKAGCYILAAARRVDRLKTLCDEINQTVLDPSNIDSKGRQPRAVAIELDVSSDGSTIGAAVKTAWEAFGRIDVLINNAGIRGRVHTPLDLTEEEWNQLIKTNLMGTWLVTKYVCTHMLDAKLRGSVINVSSISGLSRGLLPGSLAYDVSKAGINYMTKVMAQDTMCPNIRVNAISPGLFKSEITEGLFKKDGLKNVERKTVPLRAWGTIDPAFTSLVRYLIHDSSEYVSGNIYILDAGATLPGTPIFSSL